MKLRDRMGINFIEASLRFIPTDNLYAIIGMAQDEQEEVEQRERIIQLCRKEICNRENGKLYKVIRGVKEVWIERKE